MRLHYREYPGEGPPLVILHGLFGNQANWAWHARQLAGDFHVIAMDLRNHGRSPWDSVHDYPAMAGDIRETLAHLGLDRVHLMGHSMGGKAAMQVAFLHPELLRSLVVVDIAPVDYRRERFPPLEAMLSVDLARIGSRQDADAELARHIDNPAIREFLLTNLQQDREGGFSWRCNLQALADNFSAIVGAPESPVPFDKPVLFVKGEQSDYIQEQYGERIQQLFPQVKLKVIQGAGHWVHSEKPQVFLKIVSDFLREASQPEA